MARKVSPQAIKARQQPVRTTPPADPYDVPPPAQKDAKPQDYLGMWSMFMIVLGISMVAKLGPVTGVIAGAVIGGVLGQVLPVNDEGKRLPMPVAAGLIFVGLILIVIGLLFVGKK
jgi:hypothetical protein